MPARLAAARAVAMDIDVLLCGPGLETTSAMKFLWTVFAIFLAFCVLDIEASVFAKSTKTECVQHGQESADLMTRDGNPCKQKLVVALTITGNEVSLKIYRNNFIVLALIIKKGKAQTVEANIARIVDKSEKQIRNVQLKNPVRIRINKSPMLVNYKLYQVGVSKNTRLCAFHYPCHHNIFTPECS